MNKVYYTPEAEDDLVEIKEYITNELGSPVAAINTVARITKRIRDLEQFSEIGARLSEIVDIVTDYRFFVCGSYIAFYRVDRNDVYIIRVLNGQRDYLIILFDKLPSDETE